MNKKGMTLVELIAVIAIIGILSVLITPAIISIRHDVLENTLKSKILTINNAAKDYAQDNLNEIPNHVSNEILDEFNMNKNTLDDCLTRTVGSLISDGYLAGDGVVDTDGSKITGNDKTDIINPLNNTSLNSRIICMRYDTNNASTRKIVTYIYKEGELFE